MSENIEDSEKTVETVESEKPVKKRKHTGRKVLLTILGIIVGLVLVVLLFVSPIAKWYVEKHDTELIGREVTIGNLWINVLHGSVNIKDLTLYEEDGVRPFVQFEQFKTKIQLKELLNKKLVVKRVLLSKLDINIEEDRTWFNFNSMIDHFKSDEPKPEKEKSESEPFGLIFNNINIEKGHIHFIDYSIDNEFNLDDISITIPSVDLATLKTNVGLNLLINNDARLHCDLDLSEHAKSYILDVNLNDLDLNTAEPYLKMFLAIKDLGGEIDVNIHAQGTTEQIIDCNLTGEVNLTDISMKDTLGYQLGTIDSIYACVDNFNMNDNLHNFKRVYLTGINSAYIVYPDGSTCFDILAGKKNYTDTTIYEKIADTIMAEIEEVKETKQLHVNIEDFRFDKVNFVYEDQTLPDTFHFEISDLSLTSKNFNLDENNSIHLRANLNKLGKLSAAWSGNMTGLENHNLTLMISNLKINDFSPYCISMFGFPLEDGTLSFNSQNIISNGNLEGINKLQLAQPKVGNRIKNFEPKIPKIPLKLGLYVLTDKNDNCNLELPISGNLNDPKFSYKKAILKVFSNLIVKVATSPFRLLANDDNGQYIPFDPIGMDFSATEYTLIDNIANTLNTLPDITVELEQQINYDDAIERLCIMQLQRAYFIAQHPEIEPTSIDYLTNEAIRTIKLNDKGLLEFAKQYSEKRHLNKKDVKSIAVELYNEKAKERLPKLIIRRNDVLLNYLTNTKGIVSKRIKINSMNEAQMREYKKDTRYEVHINMDDDATEAEPSREIEK